MIVEVIPLEVLLEGPPEKNKKKLPTYRALIAGHALEQLSYRREYYDIAKHFCNREAIDKKYNESPDLLEEHLHNGPKIEQELKCIIQKFQDGSKTKQFAQEDLHHVKKYNKMLQEYAASLSTK
ncbi:hypothetical protein KY348_03820 [Candidatus Woesearchaeota archaeon]|nr:hypothetical protein [Candidatus Woesearchaeota archaeon]